MRLLAALARVGSTTWTPSRVILLYLGLIAGSLRCEAGVFFHRRGDGLFFFFFNVFFSKPNVPTVGNGNDSDGAAGRMSKSLNTRVRTLTLVSPSQPASHGITVDAWFSSAETLFRIQTRRALLPPHPRIFRGFMSLYS